MCLYTGNSERPSCLSSNIHYTHKKSFDQSISGISFGNIVQSGKSSRNERERERAIWVKVVVKWLRFVYWCETGISTCIFFSFSRSPHSESLCGEVRSVLVSARLSLCRGVLQFGCTKFSHYGGNDRENCGRVQRQEPKYSRNFH